VIEIDVSADYRKNLTVRMTGILTKDIPEQNIFLFKDLVEMPAKLRFESVVFAVQEKMGFYLWWKGGDSKKSLILPLESRGAFNFEPLQFLHSPPWAEGMSFSTFGAMSTGKAFLLILDLGKQ
jgi:hypothetical protein